MWDWWDDAVDAAADAISDGWDWVTDTAEDVKEEVESWINSAWDTATDFYEDEKEKVEDWIDYGEWWVRETFDIPDQEGKGFIGEVGDKITDWFDDTVDTAKETAEDVKEAAEDAAEDAANRAKAIADSLAREAARAAEAAAAKVGDIINNITIALGAGWEFALDAIIGLPELLTGFKTDLADWFKFDIEDFMVKLEEYSERMKPEEELIPTEEGD